MHNNVDSFIQKTLIKDKELLIGIFKEISTKFPGETLRQHAIRAAIMQFEHLYPEVMNELDVGIKRKKELAKNEHAADYDTDLQAEFAIPDGLQTRIKLVFDKINQKERFLSKEADDNFKEKSWFAKNFPRFVIPNKL